MVAEPFYDPARSYQENFEHGPFGLFANTSQHSLPNKPKSHPTHTFLAIPWPSRSVFLLGRCSMAAM
jgi:hypothetical protein